MKLISLSAILLFGSLPVIAEEHRDAYISMDLNDGYYYANDHEVRTYNYIESRIALPEPPSTSPVSWFADQGLNLILDGLTSGAGSVLKGLLFSSGTTYASLNQESLEAIKNIVQGELEKGYLDEFNSDLKAFEGDLRQYSDRIEATGVYDLDLLDALASSSNKLVNNKIFSTNFSRLYEVTELYSEAAMLRIAVLFDLTAIGKQTASYPANEAKDFMLPKLESLGSNSDYYVNSNVYLVSYPTSQCNINFDLETKQTCYDYQAKNYITGYSSAIYRFSQYGHQARTYAFNVMVSQREVMDDRYKGANYDSVIDTLNEISTQNYIPNE
jgi:hypothetical protein